MTTSNKSGNTRESEAVPPESEYRPIKDLKNRVNKRKS